MQEARREYRIVLEKKWEDPSTIKMVLKQEDIKNFSDFEERFWNKLGFNDESSHRLYRILNRSIEVLKK